MLKLQTHYIRIALGCILLLAGFVAALATPRSAHADNGTLGSSICRTDPIVILTNGTWIQMGATIAARQDEVRKIDYTLHAPKGSRVADILYPDGQPVPEFVEVFDDIAGDYYVTDTVVHTQ